MAQKKTFRLLRWILRALQDGMRMKCLELLNDLKASSAFIIKLLVEIDRLGSQRFAIALRIISAPNAQFNETKKP